jgi:fatty acid desaturase
MKTYPKEVTLAQRYTEHLHAQELPFQDLTKEQSQAIIARGRALYQWFKTHQAIHNSISLCVILLLLAGDFLVLLRLPGLFLGPDTIPGPGAIVLGTLTTGFLHGWLLYSVTVYSLHEGAAHQVIFRPIGPVTRPLNKVAGHLCRIANADPVSYAADHRSHHAHFGTEKDAEFTNFVTPRRYWLTLLPFAVFFNFSDFVAHRPLSLTRSRALSEVVTLVYHGAYLCLMVPRFGLAVSLVVLVLISPHVAFTLDRLRQFSEHNLMPVENQNGARSFGPGFWGLLIGGGPWGQPCHWMHHLIPTLPWYLQIVLHYDAARILTARQREHYFLAPFTGYPRLLWRLWTEPNRFIRRDRAR